MISRNNPKKCIHISKINDISINQKHCDELASLTKALGHPVRIKIIKILSQKEVCLCGEIVNLVDHLAQSTISQHLKILKEAGLIKGDENGKEVCYCLDKNGIKKLRVLIAEL